MLGNEASRRCLITVTSLALLAALAGAGACGGEAISTRDVSEAGPLRDTGGGQEAGARNESGAVSPIYHRTDDSQCATPRPPGTCPAGDAEESEVFECTSDSECVDGGLDGRCTNSPGGPAGCDCTYNACQTDTDCKTGELCVCHDSAYSYGGNACMPGNCRVDSDCGKDGYCSPSRGMNDCSYVAGYYCHTPQDLCTNDSDCMQGNICSWSAADERWECQKPEYCV
jgi:hypothetical protein